MACTTSNCRPNVTCTGNITTAGAAMNCTVAAYLSHPTFDVGVTVPTNAGQKVLNPTNSRYVVTTNKAFTSSGPGRSPCTVPMTGSVTASASAL